MHHPVKTSSMMSAPSRGSTSTLVTSRLRLLALSVAVSAALGATVVMAQTDDYAEVNRLMRAGQLSEALSKVDQYLTSKPRDPQMRFLKGVIQTEGGKHSDAIATFSKLTEEFPELPEPYNNLAVIYAGQSQFDKARAALEMAIRTNPSYATAHENLGDVYAKLASQAYNKALQLDGNTAAIQPKLALIRELFNPNTTKGQRPTTAVPAAVPAPIVSKAPAAAPAPAPAAPHVATAAPAVTTTTAAPAPAKPAAADGTPKEVEAAVRAWATAWAAKDTASYFAAYGKEFNP